MSNPTQPNIIMVLSDQLRRHALGVHGDPDARTPHLDTLAQKGVRFSNACSTYPICVPFRFTLMTGEYAHTRKVPGIEYAMSPAERTLADEFNDAGYETVYVGKWHLDGGHGRLGSAVQVNRTPVRRSQQGRWQNWYGFELRNGPFDTCYFKDDDPTPIKIEGYQTDGLFDIGMNHVKNRSEDHPFSMIISVEPPHDPFEAPEDLQTAWENRDITLPNNFDVEDPDAKAHFILQRKRYNAMVENLDQNMGRLMAFLDAENLIDNTVVIFVADHGEMGGAHGLRAKQWPYEESVGVPLMVWDPRIKERGGTTIEDPTCTEDLFPTLLGLAGLRPKNPLQGTDLTPLIHGEVDCLDREGVLLEFVAELRERPVFYDEVWRGFRTQKYKYTVKGTNMSGHPWQFFNLEKDPGEMNNLIDDPTYRDEIAKVHQMLCDRMIETEDHFVLSPAFGCEGVNVWKE
ncbi:MAG: sulfatase-like hydrolase/transferase [Candidatus Latescibacteria bacterium]|jgi:arylsulfatase A-like enzyme|nr:sulfatase-like hydrolase/transferase [Candidatus Latescibacterota bacterium]